MCSSCNDVFDSGAQDPVPPPDVNNMAVAAIIIFALFLLLQGDIFSGKKRKRKAKS